MTEEEKREKEERADRQMAKWWNHLTDRLLEQEEIEDYYYEYRVEPDTEEDVRYITHMYPVWGAGYFNRWDAVRRLCEKGYSLSYRKEREPVYELKCLKNKQGIVYCATRSISSNDFFECFFLKEMFFYAVSAPEGEVEWFARQLEEYRKGLAETDPKRLERVLHHIRMELCRRRNGKAVSGEQEKLLTAVSKRLPRFYHAVLCDGALWFDISLPQSIKWTLGLPDFSLMARHWEHYEALAACGEAAKEPGLWWLAEGKTMEDARLDRWSLILDNSVEKWMDRGFTEDGLEGEYEALFERMSCFFKRYCKEKPLRERYRDSIFGQLSRCKELKGKLKGTAPEDAGMACRINHLLRVEECERRLLKELEDLEYLEVAG